MQCVLLFELCCMKTQHLKSESELLELIGTFYKERNIDLIKPFLHPGVIYASEWVKETLYSKKKFENYFLEKFKSQNDSDWKMDYYVHHLKFINSYYLILKQKNDRSKTVLVEIEFKSGKIYYIHLRSPKDGSNMLYRRYSGFTRAKKLEYEKQMFYAANRFNLKGILYCLRKGADINSTNEHGETIFTVISKISRFDYLTLNKEAWIYKIEDEVLIKKIKDYENILRCCGFHAWRGEAQLKILDFIKVVAEITFEKRITLLKILLEKGADVNHFSLAEAKKGRNAIYYGVKNRNVEIVEFLLKNGAIANPKFQNTLYEDFDLYNYGHGLNDNIKWFSESLSKEYLESDPYNQEINEWKKIIELLKQYSNDKNN